MKISSTRRMPNWIFNDIPLVFKNEIFIYVHVILNFINIKTTRFNSGLLSLTFQFICIVKNLSERFEKKINVGKNLCCSVGMIFLQLWDHPKGLSETKKKFLSHMLSFMGSLIYVPRSLEVRLTDPFNFVLLEQKGTPNFFATF